MKNSDNSKKKVNPRRGEVLAGDFVAEVVAWALVRPSVFDVAHEYLKFSYLQGEGEKRVWQRVVRIFERTGRTPTIGQLSQDLAEDARAGEFLDEVRGVAVERGGEGEEEMAERERVVVEDFGRFIRKMKFLEANDRITETYNSGDKERAWQLFVKYAEDFSNFSIEGARFETVFGDFHTRQLHRLSEDYHRRYKIPTGIDELDWKLGGENGGPETGEAVLWLGDSGVGKSQCLVGLGISAVRQGYRVAHFQLEGTREQCLNRYDAAWTGTLYQEMKMGGGIPSKKMSVLDRVIKKLGRKDIIVSSEETFNAKTLADVRRELREMEKKWGKVDLILIDYLELLEVGDGHSYTPSEERFRQAKLAKGMKMLAMEFNAVVHTATQASNIPEELKNDPDFVITRAHLNEDKGKCRPFDLFITINQTRDERREEIMRLYVDKAREYRVTEPIHIANNFSHSRFYDRKRTMEIGDEEGGWEELYVSRSRKRGEEEEEDYE